MGNRTDKGLKLEDFPTDDDEIDGCHSQQQLFYQSHSVLSPVPVNQKLTQAKDYVESLHQNERAPLLYGKNNVIVQPVSSCKVHPKLGSCSVRCILNFKDFI